MFSGPALLLIGLHAFISSGVHAAFNPLEHSGPASPYFDAPDQFGISTDTPVGCSVDQAAYIVRHGARFPEPGSFSGWVSLFGKLQNNSYTASGPLAFLPSWSVPVDIADQSHEPLYLTSTGALEAFKLGVQLRQKYGLTTPSDNITVWAAAQQRVVDTASFFARGYLSQGNYLSNTSLNRGTVVTFPDSVNYTFAESLTPSAACPTYATFNNGSAQATTYRATYQTRIATRLNKFISGNLTLTATDIGVMQDLCGFSSVINGDTRFCDIFEDSEWLDYEYAQDLNYYYGSGPGNPIAAATGFPWVKAITDLFAVGPGQTTANGTFVPPPLLMSFTHDNNIPPIIAALGLWNTSNVRGTYPLSNTKIAPARTFRSSYLVTFRGYVALERLTCSEGAASNSSVRHTAFDFGGVPTHVGSHVPTGTFVRVRVNNAPVPIPKCASGPGSTCPLSDFITYVDQDRALASGDFVKTCGLQNFSNATSRATFFTNAISQSQALLLPLSGLVGS